MFKNLTNGKGSKLYSPILYISKITHKMKKKLFALSAVLFLSVAAFSQAKLVEKVTKKGDELVIPYEK